MLIYDIIFLLLLYHYLQVNPEMIMELERAGLKFVGTDETGRRMEVCICNYATKVSF